MVVPNGRCQLPELIVRRGENRAPKLIAVSPPAQISTALVSLEAEVFKRRGCRFKLRGRGAARRVFSVSVGSRQLAAVGVDGRGRQPVKAVVGKRLTKRAVDIGAHDHIRPAAVEIPIRLRSAVGLVGFALNSVALVLVGIRSPRLRAERDEVIDVVDALGADDSASHIVDVVHTVHTDGVENIRQLPAAVVVAAQRFGVIAAVARLDHAVDVVVGVPHRAAVGLMYKLYLNVYKNKPYH